MSPEALAEIEKAMSRNSGFAFPIAAAAIGAGAMMREGRTGRHSHLGAQRHRCGQGFQQEDLRQNAVIGCWAARKLGHDVARADRTGPRFTP